MCVHRHRAFLLLIDALMLASCSLLADSQTIAIQVSNPQDRPIRGAILGTKGNGSTSSPTDVAGKTQIVPEQGTHAGDVLFLILVSAPLKNPQIFSPWEGRAVVPNPQGFIDVIVGEHGDRAVLRNSKVTWAILAAIDNLNATAGWGTGRNSKYFDYQVARRRIASDSGFEPAEVDAAIRSLAEETTDKHQRKVAKRYLEDYPTPLAPDSSK
jgi:hypothetical protein